jgi:hypothetical protein
MSPFLGWFDVLGYSLLHREAVHLEGTSARRPLNVQVKRGADPDIPEPRFAREWHFYGLPTQVQLNSAVHGSRVLGVYVRAPRCGRPEALGPR